MIAETREPAAPSRGRATGSCADAAERCYFARVYAISPDLNSFPDFASVE